MFIKYDEWDLLELFENEPVYIGEKEAGVAVYSCIDDWGFCLTFCMSIYENKCSISLSYRACVILSLHVKSVARVVSENCILKVMQEDTDENFWVRLKPNIFISIDNL